MRLDWRYNTLICQRSNSIKIVRWFFLLAIIFISFFLGVAAQITFHGTWKFIVQSSGVISSVASLLTLVLAIFALNNWRKQVREDIALKSLTELEDAVTLLYLAFLEPSEELKANLHLPELHHKSIMLCYRLGRRGYYVESVKELDNSISNAVKDLKQNGVVSESINDDMFAALGRLSEKSRTVS